MWTRFMDMHSGGSLKEKQQYIYIEAPEEQAGVVFYHRFGHNPNRVTCTCCGNDYSISSDKSLKALTAYDRGCAYIGKKLIEAWNGRDYQPYTTLAEYKKRADVLIIHKAEIKPKERVGELPRQGYVWVD